MSKQHTALKRPNLDESALGRLAAVMAAFARPGDLITLDGDLGAGKTTFARAFIRNLTGNIDEEIPSPTFTLVQTYDGARMSIAHYDLYRLADPAELVELGMEDALARGVALVEWPERGGDYLPAERLTVRIADAADAQADRRDITIEGTGPSRDRVQRLNHILTELDTSHWNTRDTTITYLQGDASARRYARLTRSRQGDAPSSAVLMDAPRQPDGPPIRNGLPYSRIAHLAEDVRPFVAVADGLRASGIATPEIYATNLDAGLLLIEDFGDEVYGRALRHGVDQELLWSAALDVLVHLRRAPADLSLPVAGADPWTLPRYDADAMAIEVDLLADWLWPFATGAQMPDALRQDYTQVWRDLIAELQALPTGWTLRDYHSPNLIWRTHQQGIARVGVIDFQDAMQGPLAYDVVSLLQDARLDVTEPLERTLLDTYCTSVARAEPDFDETEFRYAYAALGAQRATKILGIFARLARRDGKPQYVAHMPRIWGYLQRCLVHPHLRDLKSFYDTHVLALARSQG